MDKKRSSSEYMLRKRCRERRLKRREMRLMGSEPVPSQNEVTNEVGGVLNLDLNIDINDEYHVDPASSSKERVTGMSSGPQEMTPILESPAGPVYGLMAASGRMSYMEDKVSLVTNLCRPWINRHRPLHFFGLFDGHGGVQVADICKDWMHVLMEEEVMQLGNGYGMTDKGKGKEIEGSVEEVERMLWMMAIKRCFYRTDQLAMAWCPCGRPINNICICDPRQEIYCGSTAVVTMLTPQLIVVANCGDSRAVLCRAGMCVPLTSDHKPDRADELVRIEANGGQVLYLNGPRVQGVLAMSRAMGDKSLKPMVSSEPEICFMKRDPRDECLIIASDGLWDVVSNRLACEIASNCLRDGANPYAGLDINNAPPPMIGNALMGFNFSSTSAFAAAILARLALGRGTWDNVSVVVVDLRM